MDLHCYSCLVRALFFSQSQVIAASPDSLLRCSLLAKDLLIFRLPCRISISQAVPLRKCSGMHALDCGSAALDTCLLVCAGKDVLGS